MHHINLTNNNAVRLRVVTMREDDILSSLNKYFHHNALRPGQMPIIEKILDERDVLVCKETGFGKSLCFQLPGLMREGLVVVVSPLLSRIERECQDLSYNQVKCAYLCSNMNTDLRVDLDIKSKTWEDLRCIKTSGLKFLYVTLEYLMKTDRLKIMLADIYKKNMLLAIVIDELNYCTQWVDSFKRNYSYLGSLRKKFIQTSFLCFTGPLCQEKLLTVKSTLHLNDPYVLNEPSVRCNVSYKMMYVDDNLPIPRLAKHIKECYDRKSGLVYCSNEDYCKSLVTMLKKNNIPSIFYTNKLTNHEKDWINNINKDGVVIVCLSGTPVDMNFQKIDFTVHACIPIALDIFIEETSRVGKNGTRGDCIVLYTKEDSEFYVAAKVISYKDKIVKAVNETRRQLLSDLRIFRQELFEVTLFAENVSVCRQVFLMKYLNDENVTEPCGACDICLIMEKSFVIDFSHTLKKILMAIWAINQYQVKGVKSEDYIFASITFLIDLLRGTLSEHTDFLCNEWFFGSLGSWDQDSLHTLVIVLLIQKFASINLVANNELELYQNLVITAKGQEFVKSTCEFGISFSTKDVRFNRWLNGKWVKTQFRKDLEAIVHYYQKHKSLSSFDSDSFCRNLCFLVPSTWNDFLRSKIYYRIPQTPNTDEKGRSEFEKDLFNTCLMYHRILQNLKNGVQNNKATYKTEAK